MDSHNWGQPRMDSIFRFYCSCSAVAAKAHVMLALTAVQEQSKEVMRAYFVSSQHKEEQLVILLLMLCCASAIFLQ